MKTQIPGAVPLLEVTADYAMAGIQPEPLMHNVGYSQDERCHLALRTHALTALTMRR